MKSRIIFEIVLYTKAHYAGRVQIDDDAEIIAVVENGQRRTPRSKSFNAAIKHLQNETDLEPIESIRVEGRPLDLHRTYRRTYCKPDVYVQAQHDRWACAYKKADVWWVHRAGKSPDTRFESKSQAMANVNGYVGYDHMADLHKKTVVKGHETRQAKYLREERERAERRAAMMPQQRKKKAAKDMSDLGFG